MSRGTFRRAAAAVAVAVAVVLGGGTARAGTVFTVKNTNDGGSGSLRRAINDANQTAGKDTIAFAIQGSGVHVIQPASPLPPLMDPVLIDATTQPGYAGKPLVALIGQSQQDIGLEVGAGDTVVRGLDLGGFLAAIALESAGNIVEGNVIGADANGVDPQPNVVGVAVLGNGNRIGGTVAADRNVISGNTYGVEIPLGANQTLVEGNYIGTDATGKVALANQFGAAVLGAQSSGNQIGARGGGGNVISGNDSGIWIAPCEPVNGFNAGACKDTFHGPTGTQVNANLIGVDATGANALGNAGGGFFGGYGVFVHLAPKTSIGGVRAASGNVIAASSLQGVYIQGSKQALVAANMIGTNAAGTAALGNGLDGVRICCNSPNSLVGEFDTPTSIRGAPNVISGNGLNGVVVQDSNRAAVLQNRIGTNAAGTAAIPNAANGVAVIADSDPAQGNTIGDVGQGNLISGNAGAGVYLDGSINRDNGGPGATNNVVLGNTIGLTEAHDAALPNQVGISTFFGDDNVIGQCTAGGANLVGESALDGISIAASVRNSLSCNSIAFNGRDAVRIDGFENVVKQNVITGNPGAGVDVRNGLWNVVEQNSISANGGLGIDLAGDGVTP